LPNRITNAQIKNKKMNKEFSAGAGDEIRTKDDNLHVSPACIKPNVVRRLESCMSKFGEAHNMLARTKLSKEDYQPISTLLASAKVELFNIYYELKNNQL
jgi:hypothetical protein